MGNSLSSTTPAEIMPVEFYINDLVDQESIETLGSTRFMKVARGRTNEDGIQVLKVFVFPVADPSQLTADPSQIEAHCLVMMQIRDALISSANCCPIKKILKKQKHAIICRPYQKYTLFDRLSTRPFVVETERLWYMYQLFKALLQCEEAKICHGDIKSQNILISSSNWLQLTDFASFKPAFLPVDNPSNYTYYFDTSRRQTCNIAPERFLGPEEYSRQEDKFLQYESLRPSMDMFSAGCVIYEMTCDGKSPFTYGDLCEYSKMSPAEAAKFLDDLLAPVSSTLRPLLRTLLAKEPSLRPTASNVLADFAHLFPPVFETFLYNYLNVFRPKEVYDINHRSISCFEPDDIIGKVSTDMKTVIWPQVRANQQDSNRPDSAMQQKGWKTWMLDAFAQQLCRESSLPQQEIMAMKTRMNEMEEIIRALKIKIETLEIYQLVSQTQESTLAPREPDRFHHSNLTFDSTVTIDFEDERTMSRILSVENIQHLNASSLLQHGIEFDVNYEHEDANRND